MMKIKGNNHIEKYLDDYIKMKAPGYAVLVSGKWGSGKTYFIDKYIESKETSDTKFVKVSLYGVSKRAEVQELILTAVHPLLKSKGAKILSGLFKIGGKLLLKYDANSDGKDDISMNAELGSYDFLNDFNKVKNRILVFDDLERCDMPIKNLLGYINNFVENDGQKVILIGHEEVLQKRAKEEKGADNYLRIKEKLIGKTFKIIQNQENAFDLFVDHLNKSSQINPFLIKSCKTNILDYFKYSESENLRHLKNGIIEFYEFLHYLPKDAFNHTQLINELLTLFFIFFFEERIGNQKESFINDFFDFGFLPSIDKNSQSTNEKLVKKYCIVSFSYYQYNPVHFDSFIRHGFLNKKDFHKSILSTQYFYTSNTPTWERLHGFWSLEDNEFAKLENQLFKKLENQELDDQYIVIHVYGIYLRLIKEGIVARDETYILSLAKKNIQKLKKEKKLKQDVYESTTSFVYEKIYHMNESQNFNIFFNFVNTESKDMIIQNLPHSTAKLLDDLKKSVHTFGEKISIYSGKTGEFYNIPIFKYFNVDEFSNIIFTIPNNQIGHLSEYIKFRYQNQHTTKSLLEDLSNLETLFQKLDQRVKKIKKQPIKKTLIQKILLKELKSSIDVLKRSHST